MANNPNHMDNLEKHREATQFSSGDEAVMKAKKGGKKKAENIKAKKLFKEAITDILDIPANDQMLKMIQNAFGIKGENITLKEAMIYAQALKAISDKDTQAFNALVDRVEGKPKQSTELTVTEEIPLYDNEKMREIKKRLGDEDFKAEYYQEPQDEPETSTD